MNRRTGQAGEDAAAIHLVQKGYTLLARNYRVPWGEIDLVAEHQGVLCFIEVKRREQGHFGHPLDAVDQKKRNRIIRAAKTYLAEKCISPDKVCRFDVVSIDEDHRIILITDAFQS